MKFLANVVLKYKKTILFLFALALAACAVLRLVVDIQYDMSSYLPEESDTMIAANLMKDEFGYPSTATVMVKNITVKDAAALSGKIEEIYGVKDAMWLNDVADIYIPVEDLNSKMVEVYYKDGNALFQVEFYKNGFNPATSKAIDDIRALVVDSGFEVAIGGEAAGSKETLSSAGNAMVTSIIVAGSAILLLLLVATTSLLEPVLYLAAIGVAVLLNMGTNVIFGEISFITNSIQMLMLLAVSMDYSLFLFHRIEEERPKYDNIEDAIKVAMRQSAVALSSSCLTTVAGFAALGFMRYRIGADLGFVLVKGIILALVCVIVLMPIMYYYTYKLIDKFKHKVLWPNFYGFSSIIIKMRFLIVPLCVIIALPMFIAQGRSDFIYGEEGARGGAESPAAIEQQAIDDAFGKQSRILVLVPNGDLVLEGELCDTLALKPYIESVQGLATIVDRTLPQSFLPQSVVKNFKSENYTRILLYTNLDKETKQNFGYVEDLEKTVGDYYDEYYVAGKYTSVYDIKTMVEVDNKIVNLVSIAAVFLILLINFRSLSIPFILTFVIELSIWINMSIPYFEGSKLVFLGYMIVSSVQLGATIDYAILLTDRYKEFRIKNNKVEAVKLALTASASSILTSAFILGATGFTLGFTSKSVAVSSIGLLLGRGALLSSALVLILLPQLLVLLDGVIQKTTIKAKDIENENRT